MNDQPNKRIQELEAEVDIMLWPESKPKAKQKPKKTKGESEMTVDKLNIKVN